MSKYGGNRISSFWDIRLQRVALFFKRAIVQQSVIWMFYPRGGQTPRRVLYGSDWDLLWCWKSTQDRNIPSSVGTKWSWEMYKWTIQQKLRWKRCNSENNWKVNTGIGVELTNVIVMSPKTACQWIWRLNCK